MNSNGLSGKSHAAILVVDDSLLLLGVIQSLLLSEGYPVLTATSASGALGILATAPENLQLIISDLKLGEGIGGADFLETAVSQWPQVKAILMSGGFCGDATRFPFPVLAKPFRLEQLLELVQSLLSDAESRKALS